MLRKASKERPSYLSRRLGISAEMNKKKKRSGIITGGGPPADKNYHKSKSNRDWRECLPSMGGG